MFFSLFSTHFKWSKPGLKQNCEASLFPINQDFLESCQYIAVANEKYFYHILITPFLLCISSQMPNIAGFFGIFLFLCFRGIFSNLPVFSRAFPCNIGKSVGK